MNKSTMYRSTIYRSTMYRSIILGFLIITAPAAFSEAKFNADTASFVKGNWPDRTETLCGVAQSTNDYLEQGESYDPTAIHGGHVAGARFPLTRIKATLVYLCKIYQEDKQAHRPSRLTDPAFVEAQFERVRWLPDRQSAAPHANRKPLLAALPEDQLLITRYYVHQAIAVRKSDNQHPHALYGLPFDEHGLSLAKADEMRPQLTRFRYGKQAALQGALVNLAPPLVWLSRTDLEAALLQGTLVARLGDEHYQVFNVHRNNGIAYDRGKSAGEQQRYWYFRQVDGIRGYGKDADFKVHVAPKVTVAGDIAQLGLGKVFLIAREEGGALTYRLSILADTGGAFSDNLYQLDWLSGFYAGREAYQTANAHIGDYAKVWLLLKK